MQTVLFTADNSKLARWSGFIINTLKLKVFINLCLVFCTLDMLQESVHAGVTHIKTIQ